jgi:hypothetical protein
MLSPALDNQGLQHRPAGENVRWTTSRSASSAA